jgi:DNA-directed RNA polymerase specialized sigma24 family protein
MHQAAFPERRKTRALPEFEALFQEHISSLLAVCGVTGRVEDAEDVVQTIFLKLLPRSSARLHEPNPRSAFIARRSIRR